jgi:hypothetical protein
MSQKGLGIILFNLLPPQGANCRLKLTTYNKTYRNGRIRNPTKYISLKSILSFKTANSATKRAQLQYPNKY